MNGIVSRAGAGVIVGMVLASCAPSAGPVGVERFSGQETAVLSASADVQPPVLFDTAPEPRPWRLWPRSRMTARDMSCWTPFLVVNTPDGSAADVYYDTRC